MKKCTYCGKEYPDDAKVCAIDQEPLASDKTEVKPDAAGAKQEVPDGFIFLCAFEPLEAARILRRFEDVGIDYFTEKGEIMQLDLPVGGHQMVPRIGIFVQVHDEERAKNVAYEDYMV